MAFVIVRSMSTCVDNQMQFKTNNKCIKHPIVLSVYLLKPAIHVKLYQTLNKFGHNRHDNRLASYNKLSHIINRLPPTCKYIIINRSRWLMRLVSAFISVPLTIRIKIYSQHLHQHQANQLKTPEKDQYSLQITRMLITRLKTI